MKYARIENNFVTEICFPIPGFTIDQCYHQNIVSKLVECAEEVEVGWSYNDNVFAEPVEEVVIAEPVEEVVVEEPTTPEAV